MCTYIYTVIISALLLKACVRFWALHLLHQQNRFFPHHFFAAHLSKTVCGTLCAFEQGHLKPFAHDCWTDPSPLPGKASSPCSCRVSTAVCHGWHKWEPTAPLLKVGGEPVEHTTSPDGFETGLLGCFDVRYIPFRPWPVLERFWGQVRPSKQVQITSYPHPWPPHGCPQTSFRSHVFIFLATLQCTLGSAATTVHWQW